MKPRGEAFQIKQHGWVCSEWNVVEAIFYFSSSRMRASFITKNTSTLTLPLGVMVGGYKVIQK